MVSRSFRGHSTLVTIIRVQLTPVKRPFFGETFCIFETGHNGHFCSMGDHLEKLEEGHGT